MLRTLLYLRMDQWQLGLLSDSLSTLFGSLQGTTGQEKWLLVKRLFY
jgi:hypothetical protein